MTDHYQKYVGKYPYKVDPKFRISILTSWRPKLGEILFLMVSSRQDLPVIKVLSQESYNKRVESVLTSGKSLMEQDDLLGALASCCHKASLNEQNKLLVGKEVAERVGIAPESNVRLVGRGIYFEIWSEANFLKMEEYEKSSKKQIDYLGIL